MGNNGFEVDPVSGLWSRSKFWVCIFLTDFAKIEDCVPKPLATSLSFRISGRVWNIALPPAPLRTSAAFCFLPMAVWNVEGGGTWSPMEFLVQGNYLIPPFLVISSYLEDLKSSFGFSFRCGTRATWFTGLVYLVLHISTHPSPLMFVYWTGFNWKAFSSSEKCDEDYMGCAGPSGGQYPIKCDQVDIQPPSDKHQQYQWGPHGAE